MKNYNKKGGFIYLQFIMNKIEQYFFSKEAKILFEPAKKFEKQATALGGQSLAKSVYELFTQEFLFREKAKYFNDSTTNE